jgi:N-acetylglucosamine-6-phosphate deacetylase
MSRLKRRQFLAAGAMMAAASVTRAGSSAVAREQGAARRLTTPGFIDLQVNGFGGVDFNDPALAAEQVHAAVAAMRRTGVTQSLPTIITSPLERFALCARTVVRANAAGVLGIHMEGPYISPQDGARGAHAREYVRAATVDDFDRRQEAAEGRIRLVTVAPEVEGVLPLIERLVGSGIRVAIGHTAATPEQIQAAVRAGATLSTHLGNGIAQTIPRHPNVIWEQLASDGLTATLIVDGHHLPGSTVKAMVRAKTPARVILVTDATAAAGQPPGEYELSGVRVRLDEAGRVAVPGQPNLAGSALSLDRAVANTARFTGLPLDEVLPMVTRQPAAYLGVEPLGDVELDWNAAAFELRVVRSS